jgi:hypothetical protein
MATTKSRKRSANCAAGPVTIPLRCDRYWESSTRTSDWIARRSRKRNARLRSIRPIRCTWTGLPRCTLTAADMMTRAQPTGVRARVRSPRVASPTARFRIFMGARWRKPAAGWRAPRSAECRRASLSGPAGGAPGKISGCGTSHPIGFSRSGEVPRHPPRLLRVRVDFSTPGQERGEGALPAKDRGIGYA